MSRSGSENNGRVDERLIVGSNDLIPGAKGRIMAPSIGTNELEAGAP